MPQGQDLSGNGIDDFNQDMVFIDVEIAVLGLAVEGHPRPPQFGQPVGLMGLHAHPLLDLLAHLHGPGLGPEDPDA